MIYYYMEVDKTTVQTRWNPVQTKQDPTETWWRRSCANQLGSKPQGPVDDLFMGKSVKKHPPFGVDLAIKTS